MKYLCKKNCYIKDVEGSFNLVDNDDNNNNDEPLLKKGITYETFQKTRNGNDYLYEIDLEGSLYSLSFMDNFFTYFYTIQEMREIEIDKILNT